MTPTPSARGPEPVRRKPIKTDQSWETKQLSIDFSSNFIPSMITQQQLQESSQRLFDAFSSSQPSSRLLPFFSTSAIIQHAPVTCPHPATSRLKGSNAVRSYFDILATHWDRSNVKIAGPWEVDEAKRSVTVKAEATWTWRRSGKKWTEEFTWTHEYDEAFKISSFIVQTTSGPTTCVMRATDADPIKEKPVTEMSLVKVSN